MKFILILLSTISIQVVANAKGEVVVVERGGCLSALFNRSTLREYAKKIENAELSFEELQDYIKKGGDINAFEPYDNFRSMGAGSQDVTLLNYFISSAREDRLKSVELLLAAGADPNRTASSALGGAILSRPLIFAASGNDLPTIELLLKNGADASLSDQKYVGKMGPAIVMATEPQVLDILAAHMDLNNIDDQGNTVLHGFLSLMGPSGNGISVEQGISQIKWALARDVSSSKKNKDGVSAMDAAAERILSAREIVDYYKDRPNLDKSAKEAKVEFERLAPIFNIDLVYLTPKFPVGYLNDLIEKRNETLEYFNEKFFGMDLQEVVDESTDSIQVYKSSSAGFYRYIQSVTLRRTRPGKDDTNYIHVSFSEDKICNQLKEITDKYGLEAEIEVPTLNAPSNEFIHYNYKMPWGALIFGFDRENRKCLKTVCLKYKFRAASDWSRALDDLRYNLLKFRGKQ